MPLARVSLRRGKPATYRKAILEGIYQALRDTFDVPEGDRFMILTEHDEDDFIYDADYLGIRRSDDLIIIQITVSNTRPTAQKQKLYRRIVDRLIEKPRPACRRYFHQPGRGTSGKLVVRQWRGAIRPMTAMPALSARMRGIVELSSGNLDFATPIM